MKLTEKYMLIGLGLVVAYFMLKPKAAASTAQGIAVGEPHA